MKVRLHKYDSRLDWSIPGGIDRQPNKFRVGPIRTMTCEIKMKDSYHENVTLRD